MMIDAVFQSTMQTCCSSVMSGKLRTVKSRRKYITMVSRTAGSGRSWHVGQDPVRMIQDVQLRIWISDMFFPVEDSQFSPDVAILDQLHENWAERNTAWLIAWYMIAELTLSLVMALSVSMLSMTDVLVGWLFHASVSTITATPWCLLGDKHYVFLNLRIWFGSGYVSWRFQDTSQVTPNNTH